MEQIVENHEIPIRLDRYLRNLNKNLLQSVIEKAIRKGQIKIGGARVRAANIRISNGDVVTFPNSFSPTDEGTKSSSRNKELAAKLLDKLVLFEHESFYAFEKPAKLPTQGGSKISMSLDDAFAELGLRIVHRLDKDTSGIILAAKTRDAAIILTKAFEDKKISKVYHACTGGKPTKDKGLIEDYISKKDRHLMQVSNKPIEGSKEAITRYELVKSSGNMSLIKFMPVTGRMHQIRLHAKKIKCPIIGDKKYDGKVAKYLMLHSSKMLLDKSIFGEEITVTSNLPEYFPIKE